MSLNIVSHFLKHHAGFSFLSTSCVEFSMVAAWYQGIIQTFKLGVGFHVSITFWCKLCSWVGDAVSSRCKLASLFPILLYITARFAYMKHLFLATRSNFSVLQIRFADTLSFGSNALPPHCSYCFPYFLPHEKCLFLLSLKTQQWHMLTQPHSQCFFPNAERFIGEESRSIATHFAFSCVSQTTSLYG